MTEISLIVTLNSQLNKKKTIGEHLEIGVVRENRILFRVQQTDSEKTASLFSEWISCFGDGGYMFIKIGKGYLYLCNGNPTLRFVRCNDSQSFSWSLSY